MGQSQTAREAYDRFEAEVKAIWDAIAELERKIAKVDESSDYEKEEIWTALANLDKAFKEERGLIWDKLAKTNAELQRLKEDFDDKMVNLYKYYDKSFP